MDNLWNQIVTSQIRHGGTAEFLAGEQLMGTDSIEVKWRDKKVTGPHPVRIEPFYSADSVESFKAFILIQFHGCELQVYLTDVCCENAWLRRV